MHENSLRDRDGEENQTESNQKRAKLLASDKLYSRVIRMVDVGEINEAENLLSDEFLEDHNYSREEVRDGAQSLAERKGLGGLGE